MALKSLLKTALVLGLILVGTTSGNTSGSASETSTEFSFFLTNETTSEIDEVLVSEDGEKWAYFDIGSGIAPGETTELIWDPSTNGQSCSQFIIAVYADETESEPAIFDFCEETDLVFSE